MKRKSRPMTRYEKGLHRLSKLVRAVEKKAASRDEYIRRLEGLINQCVTETSNLRTQIFASGIKALSYGADFKPMAPCDACNTAAGLKK